MTIPCWNLISKTLRLTAVTIPSTSFPFLISLGSFAQKNASLLIFLYFAYTYFSYLSKLLLKWSWWKHYFFFNHFSLSHQTTVSPTCPFYRNPLVSYFRLPNVTAWLIWDQIKLPFLHSLAMNKLSYYSTYCQT